MPCCVAHKYGHWCSGEETLMAEDGKEYCVYHAPSNASQKPKGKEFYQMVRDRIKNSSGDCRFDGSVFPGHIPLKSLSLKGSLFFDHCRFEGNFSLVSSYIRGDVSFKRAIFLKKLSIGEPAAKGLGSMKNHYFYTTKSTSGIQFYTALKIDGDINFDRALLHGSLTLKQFSSEGKLDFSYFIARQRVSINHVSAGSLESKHAKFKRAIRLLDLTISGKADFGRAKFNDFITIMRCDFQGLVYFSNTKFKSRLRIRNSRFKEAVFFERTEFNEASFPLCHFGERVIFSDVDLQAVSFHKSPVESFYFVGCNWLDYKGRAVTVDVLNLECANEYKEIPSPLPPVHSLSGRGRATVSAKALAELYRRLKKLSRVESDEVISI